MPRYDYRSVRTGLRDDSISTGASTPGRTRSDVGIR
jgi:hypothetical protein